MFDLPSSGIALPVLAPPGAMEEVFVLGSFDPSLFEVSERDTNQIVDTLGLEQLARFADTNVAASCRTTASCSFAVSAVATSAQR